jgi:ribulose kinase
MQMLSDVLNMDIDCLTVKEATALGTSVWGAVAAGCYSTVQEASKKMKAPIDKTYHPIAENVAEYEKLFEKYCVLYEYFARENKVMEFLYDNKLNVLKGETK